MARQVAYLDATGRIGKEPWTTGDFTFFNIVVNQGAKGRKTQTWFTCGCKGDFGKMIQEHTDEYKLERLIRVRGRLFQRDYRAQDGHLKQGFTVWLDQLPDFMEWLKGPRPDDADNVELPEGEF